MADKKSSGTPQTIIEQKAPFKWWLVLLIIGVLAAAVLLFAQFFATPADPCPPLYLAEESIPNPIDNLQGDQASLVFPLSGGDIPADMEFTAYWNVRVRHVIDSYIRPSSVACSADYEANSLTCAGLSFYFPDGADEVIPEISIVSNSAECGKHTIVDLETVVDQSSQLLKILRYGGEFTPSD